MYGEYSSKTNTSIVDEGIFSSSELNESNSFFDSKGTYHLVANWSVIQHFDIARAIDFESIFRSDL